ncbi:MAG: glycosyltransferase family 9 protein [Nanoarchaeota archaeon]|nr:glycosyltransferase family 9 protein [Nanoarchaeota archaeon]
MVKKILIIKLGAKGDVVRTLSILPALKKKYPESEIYWLTKQNITDLLQNHPLISKVLAIPFHTTEKFDILYNFDIEEEATKLAKEIKADEKYGFYSDSGYPTAFNLNAEYYLNTLFDDDLKKTNRKTYQEMMSGAAALPYNKEYCPIYLNDEDKKFAEDFLENNSINKEKLIGIHMGTGPRWPSKAWSKEKIKEFIIKVKQLGYEVILFGGPDEINQHAEFLQELEDSNIKVYQNNPYNSNREFAALVNLCDKIVCSDSLALHISIALKKPTICLFFCTTPHEIEGYGFLKKIISPMLYDFFPEKQDQYNEELVNSISVEEVLSAL